MVESKIGIVILGTNAYSVLMVRFVKRFMQFYKGNRKIKFFLFSDVDPHDYLPEGIDYEFIYTTNSSWVDGTNLKFKSILSLEKDGEFGKTFTDNDVEYLYYLDADSNIDKEFTEDWFLGDSVAGQHFADQTWMKDKKGFERNPRSKAYVPLNTSLPQVYTYGAFWGGKVEWVINFCRTMLEWQQADKSWGYEPSVNDESFSNAYFHFNPPSKLVLTNEFKFLVSDKGGIQEMRNMSTNVEQIKKDLLLYRNDNINIQNGKVVKE